MNLDMGSGRGVFLIPFLTEFPWAVVNSAVRIARKHIVVSVPSKPDDNESRNDAVPEHKIENMMKNLEPPERIEARAVEWHCT